MAKDMDEAVMPPSSVATDCIKNVATDDGGITASSMSFARYGEGHGRGGDATVICRNVLNAVRRVFQFLHRAIAVATEHHILKSSYCGTSTGQLFAVHRNGPVWPAKLFPVSRLPGEDLLELRAGEVADGVIPVDENAQYIVTNHFAAADLGLFISSEFASDATKGGEIGRAHV